MARCYVYLYSSRTPREGTGDADVADVPVYRTSDGKRVHWLGSSWHGSPEGTRWAVLDSDEIDEWLSKQGLERRTQQLIGG